jgi:hypothetical protein
MTIEIPETPGKCRWCGCTYDRPCEGACGWANRRQTLCTACVTVDRLVKSARGRAQLVQTMNDAEADS